MSTMRPGSAGSGRPASAAPGGGPMRGMFGAPPTKSKDFRGSFRRLLKEVGEERKSLVLSHPASP